MCGGLGGEDRGIVGKLIWLCYSRFSFSPQKAQKKTKREFWKTEGTLAKAWLRDMFI
jgi:hypothetical protein